MLEDMKKDILELKGKLPHSIEMIEKSTKICMYSDSHCEGLSDPNSVNHIPSRLKDTETFSELLHDEL